MQVVSTQTFVSPKPLARARVVTLLLVLAFAFLGSRGIWDPDEGRYTNVAANMLATGDWLMPHRSEEVGHWTKPPLTYWVVAASLGVFGLNPWAARIPVALAYLATTFMVARIARRVAPGRDTEAALIFATMLVPAIASQLVTTDFLLTAFETLAMWAYVELRWGDERAHWRWLLWLAFALAFLTKGPPGLLPLLAIAVAERATHHRHRVFHPIGFVVFGVVALWWFAVVIDRNPHLLPYFLGMEVVNRVATNEFSRHGEWYGWLVIYVPTLLIGTVPWTFRFLGWLRALPARARTWRDPEARERDGAQLFVLAWLLLPLIVFCIARSRLPLYVLPLFVPIAIAAVLPRATPAPPFAWQVLIVWVPSLLAIRLLGAMVDAPQDARAWADAIRARAPGPVDQVVFVDDTARYGLRLHLNAEVEDVSLDPAPPPADARINPTFDEDVARELLDDPDPTRTIWIVDAAHWPRTERYIASHGYRAQPLGTPFQGRVMFRATSVGGE
jgi:4-amino-4-deoxy-L-arabinose transferase-like glycosyltransferase